MMKRSRCQILAQIAREVELSILILSTTEDGYKTRSRARVSAMKVMHTDEAWEWFRSLMTKVRARRRDRSRAPAEDALTLARNNSAR